MREIIVDSFAGGGGASTGIELALGRSPDIAINHDATALAMHAINHPATRHLTEDVWAVDPRSACEGRPVGLFWASPDCFLPGTLILTPRGLEPIETIAVGDQVLSHRGRWRRVTSTMTREADTVEVRGQGHYGLITTPDHQFYSKVITKRWPRGKKGKGRRPGVLRTLVENPYWPAAKNMEGKLWATPRAFPAAAMPLPNVSISDDFFYFLGRWIGDGSINKGDVEICCGARECDEFEQRIKARPLRDGDGQVIPYRVVDHGSSRLFVWGNAALVRWLDQEVRTGSECKRLPLWCLSMPRSWREALLAGYVDADGYVDPAGVFQTSSVSKALSIGMRLLVNSLGFATSLYRTPGRAGQIEGRSFIARDAYVVRWRPGNERETTFTDTLHSFSSVKEVKPSGPRTVVSLQVEEDESFVADGIVVHNCKHFSKAKGGKPVEKSIRSLAWVVVHWANTVAPRVIILENVEEFSTWGPLGADGRPCPLQKGVTFKRWVSELERIGYAVEWRELRACDYGAPTIRKRLFLIARRDGQPIIWPEQTHGDPKSEAVKQGALKPWRTAAEIIDWSLPCPSIFASSAEIMAEWGVRAVRPLQPATMARIAKGVKRYVLDAAKPFIVNLTHHGAGQTQDADNPLNTVTAAHRGEKALVAPFAVPRYGERDGQEPRTRSLQEPMPVVVPTGNGASLVAPFISAAQQGGAVRDAIDPLHTVTASPKDQNQIIAAHLTEFRGGHVGASLEDPAATVTANSFIKRPGGAAPVGVVAAHLSAYYGEGNGGDVRASSPSEPLRTQTVENRHAVVAAHLATMRNAQKPHQGADQPSHTVTAGGARMHLVAAFMAQHNYLEPGHDAREPVSTIVGKGSTQGLAAVNLLRQFGTGVGSAMDEPARTVMADGQGKTQLSAAFLQKYYGVDQDPQLGEPLHTATTKDRFGVVTVDVDGVTYVITDIGMRMLTPRELFRAQGFPESYVIDRRPDGSPISKTDQVSKCGNSVCPPIAAALVKANYRPDEIEPAPEFLEAAE